MISNLRTTPFNHPCQVSDKHNHQTTTTFYVDPLSLQGPGINDYFAVYFEFNRLNIGGLIQKEVHNTYSFYFGIQELEEGNIDYQKKPTIGTIP